MNNIKQVTTYTLCGKPFTIELEDSVVNFIKIVADKKDGHYIINKVKYKINE